MSCSKGTYFILFSFLSFSQGVLCVCFGKAQLCLFYDVNVQYFSQVEEVLKAHAFLFRVANISNLIVSKILQLHSLRGILFIVQILLGIRPLLCIEYVTANKADMVTVFSDFLVRLGS